MSLFCCLKCACLQFIFVVLISRAHARRTLLGGEKAEMEETYVNKRGRIIYFIIIVLKERTISRRL